MTMRWTLFAVWLGACGGNAVPTDAAPTNDGSSPQSSDGAQSSPADLGNLAPSDAAPASPDAAPAGCGNLVPPVPTTTGPSYHVAVSGSDANDGSSAHPFATLARALRNVQAGTRVNLGDGTYSIVNEWKALTNNTSGNGPAIYNDIVGTAAEPIVITAEPNAHPIFDSSGVSTLAFSGQAVFAFNQSAYVFVDSIELVGRAYPTLNSDGSYTGTPYVGSGVGFGNSKFCTLTRSTIHQIPEAAITLVGTDFVIAGNEIYDVVLINENGGYQKFQSSWPSAVLPWYQSDSSGAWSDWTRRVSYLQNTLHDSWGEGFNGLFTDTVDIVDNEIYNCWSVYIYLDHSRNVNVLRNRVYGGGLSIDDEPYGGVPFMPQDNILVANNYFGATAAAGFQAHMPLFRFDTKSSTSTNTASPQNTWSHLHVINNVIDGSQGIWFDSVKGGTAPVDGIIAGNIFLNTKTISLLDTFAWTVRDNDFVSGTPSWNGYTPSVVTGNTTLTPQFVGPTDGSTFAGFALDNASSLQVSYSTDVPADALCKPRSSPQTTAGLFGP